jgi:EmrB/QacA subfamily drug resistance transporter
MRVFKRQTWSLFAIAFMVAMLSIELSAVAVAMPNLAQSLHLSVTALLWVVNAYMLFWVVFLVPAGRLGDWVGKRRTFLLGVILFSLSATLAAFVTQLWLLIALRLLQGLGAAITFPSATAVAYMMYAPEERAKVVSVLMLVSSSALAVGPAIGGWLVHTWDWRAVFLINLPVGLLVFVLAMSLVQRDRLDWRSHWRLEVEKFDWLGLILLAIWVSSFALALTMAVSWGWLSLKTVGLLGLGVLALGLFVYAERRHVQPMMDFSLFAERTFTFTASARFFLNMAFMVLTLLLPLYLQNVNALSAEQSGFLLMAYSIGFALFSSLTPKLARYWAMAKLAGWGIVIFLVGYVLLLGLQPGLTALAVIAALVIGLGAGIAFVSITSLGMTKIEEGKSASANGVFYFFSFSGNLFGPVVVNLGIMGYAAAQLTAKLDRLPWADQAAVKRLAMQMFSAHASHWQVPAGLSKADWQHLYHMAADSFVQGMHLSAGLTIAGLLIAWILVWRAGKITRA